MSTERRIFGSRKTPDKKLLEVIHQVRMRWRLKTLLRGLVILSVVSVAAFLISSFGLERTRFTEGAVLAFRLLSYLAIAGVFVRYLFVPFFRKVSDEQVALYLEEHEPGLEAAVLTAVEAQGDDRHSQRLTEGLIESALARTRDVRYGKEIERTSLYRSSGVLTAMAVAGLVALLFGPDSLRHGASTLLFPTRSAADLNPYSITVSPGNLTISRNSDQLITAVLNGFTSEEADLYIRASSSADFERLSMIPPLDAGGAHELLLLNVGEDAEYFVQSVGTRSLTYSITVADLPYVDRIEMEYRFPAYTGLPPRTVEDAGDIAAVKGTTIRLKAIPTMATPGGTLVLNDDTMIPLETAEGGTLTGEFRIDDDGIYRIDLQMADGTPVEASPQYAIDVLEDLPPSVKFSKPGRDSQASPIEEVFLEVQADDDYGVGEVVLRYSVNGGEEQSLSLFNGSSTPMREVSAAHTLYLEEFDFEPGDMISYYAEVSDNNRVGGSQSVTSDIYFLRIRPFGMEFRQAEQQGGGQGQGQGQQGPETALSELQKEIIAATFNINRAQENFTDDEFSENVVSVNLAQGRVKEQVRDLIVRMQNRGPQADEEFERIMSELPKAIEEMDQAEELLADEKTEEALGPEQRALLHLQKAEEMYEVYVQEQQGGGGGGQAQANAEDLADLFELELDKLQNQYEQVQRGQQQQMEEQVDETLERLKELARRQQQEAERQRRRAAAGQQNSSSGGGASQRDLAEETEEAARELERLARQNNSQELQETAQQLRDAAEAMRRSAANSGNSGTAEAERALEQLEDARRLLEKNQNNRLARNAEDALQQVRGLQQQQQEVTEDVGGLPNSGQERAEQVRELIERKDQMTQQVANLERQLDRMAADASRENPEAARDLREASNGIRQSQLKEAIQYSRGLVQARTPATAQAFEEQTITPALEELEQQIQNALSALEEGTETDRLSEAVDQAQDLVRGVESMQQRMQQGQQDGEQRRLGERPQDAQGQEGQQGQQQGQQGEGQGQQQQGQGQQQGQQGGQQQGQQGQQGGQRGGDDRLGGGGGSPQGGLNGSRPEGWDGRREGFNPEEVRQFRSEVQQRLEDAQALRRILQDAGQDTNELREIMQALERLDDPSVYGRLDELASLQSQVIQGLKEFEYGLRRQLVEDGRELLLSGSDEVPEGFRKLVDEYYKSLAKTQRSSSSGSGGGN